MSTTLFVYFGIDTFKTFPKDDSQIDKSILETSHFCKVFTNRKFLKDSDIQNIYLGWSFAVFHFGGKFYHAGFPNIGDAIREVFQGIKESDLIMSCGENKVLACTRAGKFCFYSTEDMKLTSFNLTQQNWNIEDLVHGEMQTIALMKDGSVYQVQLVGKVSVSLNHIPLPCCVIQVSCGKEHTLFLSKEGQVYSFGNGSRGQLGHGVIDNCSTPTLLEALDGVKIKSIDCGGWHSTAVSYDGDLYIWGWNEHGQLGFPCAKLCSDKKLPADVETVCCLPKLVEFGEEKVIQTASCGSKHTAVLTENNEVWTWGWNGYGQLGRKTQPHSISDQPCQLNFLSCFVPKRVKCAFWSTLISGDYSI